MFNDISYKVLIIYKEKSMDNKSNDPDVGVHSSEKKANPVNDNYSFQNASDLITSKLGLEKVEGFSISSFFSEVFKKHDPDEVENFFTVGSKITTPSLQKSMALLPSPWLFFRVLIGAIVVYILFLMSWNEYKNINVIPGLIIVGSFAVPFSVLILFYEINTPKNVSIVRVIQLLVLGGALSIFLSLILFEMTPMLGILGASAAGIVEEIGKLATVLFAMRMVSSERYKFRINALLFGAAVGAGFAAFESAGYALRIGLSNTDAMLDNITLRGAMSPFGHIVWTAIATSAYWIARKEHENFVATISSSKFLILFAVPVGLHFIWNLPFQGPFLVKFWVLGFVAWVVILSLIQSALNEIAALALLEQAADIAAAEESASMAQASQAAN
ncbi:MAG: PrsW family intramembrane metalloprotease [Gammaproteobacteria bacterium]|nr:PrsW family intramembrane metalloprotease [Gammaproteobacteria bacterium]